MRKKKEKKEKKKTNSPKNKDKIDDKNNKGEIPREIGIFNDFIVYDKDNLFNDYLKYQKLESTTSPSLKDWLIIQRESKQTKSRFSDFFEEINQEKSEENDGKKTENKNQINEIEDEKKVDDQKKDALIMKNFTQNINLDNNNNNLFSINTFKDNKFKENDLDVRNTFFPNLGVQNTKMSINSSINNSIFNPGNQGMSTNDTGFAGISNSSLSNSNIDISNNSFNSKIIVVDIKEQNFEPNVDINKILSLKDTRTTIMIKNIPNKFGRELLLSTIDQNFKGTYDLFILPTDGNKNKNFGYSFINFTSCYYIPFFYYMFNGKKWSSTNSQKICEITYSKVQGRENLVAHYPNKIIHFNAVTNQNEDQKYVIPNEYKMFFNKIYPKQKIEEHKFYFVTTIPNN